MFSFTSEVAFTEAGIGKCCRASSHRSGYLKVIVLGNAGVGKTSILRQYVDGKFCDSYKSTIGADFMTRQVKCPDGSEVTLQLWDTCGEERFKSLGKAFYRGADCCVLVHDITNADSFAALDLWKEQFLTESPCLDKASFVVLGNKLDQFDKRKVLANRAQVWCMLNGNMPYFEVSAKDAFNLDCAFEAVVNVALGGRRPEEAWMRDSFSLTSARSRNGAAQTSVCNSC